MSGSLTNLRIMGATVFADHYLDHTYIYLMQDLMLAEMLLAKHANEKFLALFGINSKAYHADNGKFADKGFWANCTLSNQTNTFCGVGSHHQNGIAEQKIKDITLGGCTLLLHANCMLPEYISTILWPFAIECYKDWMNNLTFWADGRTLFETLARVNSTPVNSSNFHTFGCPCYILDHCLQLGEGIIPKFEPRVRMGVYVGWSLPHAANVSLILNPRTGHISPQFHVIYIDDFTTVPYLCTATVPPQWDALVNLSATIQLYTEKKNGTWQSLPKLDVESGELILDASIQSAVAETSEGDKASEGAQNQNVIDAHNKNVVRN
jgi:hypothetical protein